MIVGDFQNACSALDELVNAATDEVELHVVCPQGREESPEKKIDKKVESYSLNSGGKAGRDRALKASNICPCKL